MLEKMNEVIAQNNKLRIENKQLKQRIAELKNVMKGQKKIEEKQEQLQ